MTVDTKRILTFIGITGVLAALAGVLIAVLIGRGAQGAVLTAAIALVYMPTPALGHVLTRVVTKEGWEDLKLKPNLPETWRIWVAAWVGTTVLIAIGAVVFFVVMPQHFDPTFGTLQAQIEAAGATAEDLPPLWLLVASSLGSGMLLAPILNAPFMLGEEFGWRAYLLPKLRPIGERKALLLHGAIWGIWHAPLIALGHNYGLAYPGAPWLGIGMMTLACVWLGVCFGWLQLRSDTVWPAVIAHGMLNGVGPGVLLFMEPSAPLLLGPLPVGLIGGAGFILAAAVILAQVPETVPARASAGD